jgi:Trypsin-like peptidase domain
MIAPEITNAVLRVGDGRGFIIEAKHKRLVLTAAHCLPTFPPTHPASYLGERTYPNLLGPLGETELTVWAECLFADPLADIAILGSPDGQALWDQAEAYDALTEDKPALRIADAPTSGRAWLLSLAGEWNPCRITRFEDDHPFALGAALRIEDATAGIHGGMSGSPILTDDGAAVGLVSVSAGVGTPEGTDEAVHTGGGPNPRLFDDLPGWLLRQARD